MDVSASDIKSLIAQTAAISWEDPSPQLETLPLDVESSELLPLVGQLISQKTQNNQTVNAALSKAWFFAYPFSFAVLGPNVFLFKFTDKEHISRILNKVWNVNGFLLAIQTWLPSATLRDLSLKEVSFWIQIHGLPLQNMTLKNSIAIGKGIDQVVKVDENNGAAASFRSYLRLLVSFDVTKPLYPGFCFTRSDGVSDWISLKYERLDIYCTDCGRIGHKQPSCLARPEARNPSRYLISLKLNAFSVMPETSSIGKHQENLKTPSSSSENFLSSHPHTNLQISLTSSQNPFTSSKNPLPLPKTDTKSHPVIPCQSNKSPLSQSHTLTSSQSPLTLYPTDATLENTIESNLKDMSLFQKTVGLFSTQPQNPTNLTTSNSYSKSNQTVAVMMGPIFSEHHMPAEAEFLKPTGTNNHNTHSAPAKTNHYFKKLARMSPYNTRSPKKTLTSSNDKPAHSIAYETTENSSPPSLLTSSYTPPTLMEMKKRPNSSELAPPTKKGPGVSVEMAEPPDQTPNITPGFNPGVCEKTPARALFKAARKGKNKMVSAVNETEDTSGRKGGFAKPPQQQ
jgi:hypothetical protein